MQPALTPQAFVAKWRKSALKESAAEREHFIDLCRLIGHETPAEVDSTGVTFTFQYGASKLDGKHPGSGARQGGSWGFADVFKRSCFGWEYKGKHANLDKTYQQLLQYRESLHNPPLLVVSDFARIPTTTFETFPFPWPPGREPLDDARVQTIAAAARELVRLRDAWLNPPDASEAELKKRTLTNLYYARPT